MDFLIGRQAIFDKHKNTFGYELLYREDVVQNNSSSSIDGNTATNRVIANAFMNLGIDKIAKKGRVFINFTRDLIVQKLFNLLPKDKIVVEVLEDVFAEKEIIDALKEAKKDGYTIALDDFIFDENLEELVKLADIIKVDFIELSKEEIKKQVEIYKKYKLKLLAEKIESEEEFEFALNLGFDYFQGYFFQKPTIESQKDLAPSKITILKAVNTLNQPDCDLNKLQEIISNDMYMHIKILKFINSPFFGLKNAVSKIKQAINILGETRLKEWINILYISKLAQDKPEELILLSTIRAKFCSFLSYYFKLDEHNCYLLGIFSLIDAILNVPIAEVLKEMNYIDADVKAALLGEENRYFELLDFVKCFEEGDFAKAETLINKLNLKIQNITEKYIEAIEFSENIYNA